MVDPLTAAIAWVGAEIGGTIGATLIMHAGTVATITAVTASIAAGSAAQRRARSKARAAYNASLKDREVTIRSAIAPRRVIYGRDKVSGPLVYAQSTGDKGQYLHLVIALAAHECDAIEEIWFNDVQLPEPDAGGWITSGQYGAANVQRRSYTSGVSGGGTVTLPHAASSVTDVTRGATESLEAASYSFSHTPGSTVVSGLPSGETVTVGYETSSAAQKVRIRRYLGAAGQTADPDLVSESGGKWTSAHKGAGICYLYVRLEYDQDIFGQSGVPNISAVVRGKKVLDPRTSTTAWTDNAALIVADWLRDSTYGLRATAAEVPSAEVNAAANICDELVTIDAGGSTQKRYTFGGSFTADQSPRDVLEDLLSGMAGTCVWTQGRWLLRPGAYRTPASGAEITVDDLAGPVSIQPRASRSGLFNAVRATYRDPSQKWAEVQAPLVTNATYVAQDGGVQVVRALQLPGAMDATRAQRLAKIELERGRQAVTATLSTNMRAYDLAPTDTALLLLDRYGWGSGKVMEVVSRTWSPEGALQYTMRETAAAVYAWAYGDATEVDPAPDTELPSPYERPAALAALAVASGTDHLLRQSDGTILSRAEVTWTASADSFVQQGGSIEVQWCLSGTEAWQPLPLLPGDSVQAYIAPAPDGQAIIVRVRAINGVGVRGAWAYKPHIVVGKTEPPSTVSGLSATATPGGVKVEWAAATDLDYAETEVRYGGSWAAGAMIFIGSARSFVWPWPTAGSYTLRVRHRDTSGNESTTDATASITVGTSSLIGSAQINDGAIGRPQIADDTATRIQESLSAGPLSVTTSTNIKTLAETNPDSSARYLRASGSFTFTATAGGSGVTATLLITDGSSPVWIGEISLGAGASVTRTINFAQTFILGAGATGSYSIAQNISAGSFASNNYSNVTLATDLRFK